MIDSQKKLTLSGRLKEIAREMLGVEFDLETGSGSELTNQTWQQLESGLVSFRTEQKTDRQATKFLIRDERDTFQLVSQSSNLAADLDQRLLKATAKVLESEVKLGQQSRLLDSYSAQISRDFEELVWTRDLAVHLQESDIRVPLDRLVEQLFPVLLNTIQAAQLVVVRYEQPISRRNPILSMDQCQFQTFGQQIMERDCVGSLLEELGASARTRLIVNNRPQFLATDQEVSCFILVPIHNHDSEFGWIVAVNRSQDSRDAQADLSAPRDDLHQEEFGTFEAGILQATSVALATQAKNTLLHGEQQHLLIGIVRALVNAVDAKDHDTRGHSDRVARVSRRLAQELGFNDKQCEEVYLSGLLHDIGKIGVRDDILLKRGSLTDEEYEQLKLHPVIGYEVLKHLKQISYVLPGVLHHHESIDGSGYPDGLIADEIPLIARIIAVADAFDAMTSDRPYRKGMPVPVAEEKLRTNRGPQWDADVVQAFFNSTQDIYKICFTDGHSKVQPDGICESAHDLISHAVGLNH